MAIEFECRQLATLATNLMDSGDYEAMAALFTEDGVFVRPSTYPDGALKGAAVIVATLRERFDNSLSRHLASNLVVTVKSPDQAEGHSYFTHFWCTGLDRFANLPVPLQETMQSVGEYRDRYERTQGGWRIASRTGRFIFRKLPT
jgi:hypothetical protein